MDQVFDMFILIEIMNKVSHIMLCLSFVDVMEMLVVGDGHFLFWVVKSK